MEYNLENIDYRSKLLMGEPIEFENLKIHPLKLWEILDYSIYKYNVFIAIISYSKTEIMEALGVFNEISLYDFIMINLLTDKTNELKDIFLHFLSMITKEKTGFSMDGYFILGKNIINQKNFSPFIQIIKDQNIVITKEEKITTKKEKDYLDRVKKAREKYSSHLKAAGKSNDTDILDIISAISCKHPSINLFNIKNLTMYQLIDQLKRLNMIDEYFISIESLLAGAKKNDVDLIHWSKKIND